MSVPPSPHWMETVAIRESLEGDDKEHLLPSRGPIVRFSSSRFHVILLAASFVINTILAVYVIYPTNITDNNHTPSEYGMYCQRITINSINYPPAGLNRNVTKRFNSSSPFGTGSNNDRERSELWEGLDTSAGEISVDAGWAQGHQLPESTPFFWDQDRRIYLVNGFHSLHCIVSCEALKSEDRDGLLTRFSQRKVRRSVTLAHHGKTQLDSYGHLVHCMDHLLQDILCWADDTPMYTSQTPGAMTGLGQTRMCRSWEELSNWATSQSSCFAYINETQGVNAVIERFQFCPRGSPYSKSMRQYFNHSPEWFEEAPADMETMPRYWENFDS